MIVTLFGDNSTVGSLADEAAGHSYFVPWWHALRLLPHGETLCFFPWNEQKDIPYSSFHLVILPLCNAHVETMGTIQQQTVPLEIVLDIGRGSYGKVSYGLFNKLPCAIKQTWRSNNIEREIALFQKLSFKNIIQFYATTTHTINNEERLLIIMEYAEGGSLTRAIKYALLSRWEDKERITQDIIRGLHYLHSNDILHRDLKTDNVLLTKNFDTAKLCDFGLSMTEHHTADNEDSSAAVSHAGTRRWMAPELFDPNPAYSKKSDIYALGWIMWQIVSNRVKPFHHIRDPSKVIELIKDGKRETIPAKISEDYRKSIEACWHQDPSQRPHAEEMIKKDSLTEVGYSSDFISISVSGFGNSSSEWVPVDNAHYHRTTSGDVSLKEAAKEVDIIQLDVADYNLRIEYLFDQSQSSASETTPLDPLLSTGPAPQIVVRDFRGEGVAKGRALPVSSLTTHENSGNHGNVSHAVHIMSNQISADLVRRAKDNDVDAQFALAALYETGSDDAAKSDSTAFFWYHQAAKQGHLYGQRRVAELYYHGRGTPKSYTDAVEWYKMAAERGDAISQYQLGLLYETGRGVEKSDVEAAIWYHKSAEQGEADAQDKLGSMYQIGRGVEKSYNEAFEWYFRAAEQGHTDSQYHLGLMYKEGQGREVNYTIASKWLRKAADQGHSRAQHSLDEVNIAVQGMEKSKQRATLGIEKAAEQGNIDAQVKLGSMFANGRGVGQSYTKAIEWYRRAADQKSETAQYHLGLMYELGHGVDKSDVEAIAWYRMAAEQGSANAQYRLGLMYAAGRGVEQSDVEAVSWYRMAAYQENEAAQHNLGLMFELGCGVEKSNVDAVSWYHKAADQGFAAAQYRFGLMYEFGHGVEKNDVEAVSWYRKAADQGNVAAQFRLEKLREDGSSIALTANVLLIGGCGVGKTFLMRSLTNEIRQTFTPIKRTNTYLYSCHVTIGETTVRLVELDDNTTDDKDIIDALRIGGVVKLIFVLSYVEGRIHPSDLSMLKSVISRSRFINDFGVIINKVPDQSVERYYGDLQGSFFQSFESVTDGKFRKEFFTVIPWSGQNHTEHVKQRMMELLTMMTSTPSDKPMNKSSKKRGFLTHFFENLKERIVS